MKRLALLGVVVLLASIAWAATIVPVGVTQWFKAGINVGSDATSAAAAHRISRVRFCDVDVDLASVTTTCTESVAWNCPGVRVGDVCAVSIGPRDGGAQIATANLTFSAYSDTADTVKVRACAAGTAANAADAGYVVECHSTN